MRSFVMTDFPPLAELLWLFECEAALQFPDEHWPASAATWTTVRGRISVECTIAPFERSVQITVDNDGDRLADVVLLNFVDRVSIDREHDHEVMVVFCAPSAGLAPIRLQLKPSVSMSLATMPPRDSA